MNDADSPEFTAVGLSSGPPEQPSVLAGTIQARTREAASPPGTLTQPSFCRICAAHCGIVVEVEDGRVRRVSGDPDNPLSEGFTCSKGRSLPASINAPDRLLHSYRREPDGSTVQMRSDAAIDEIAVRLGEILEQYGPRAIAMYSGNGVLAHYAGQFLGRRFLRAIGSPMWFSSATIDQPGKEIALSMHGRWGAGLASIDNADAWMFIGVNPVVSLWAGTGIANPLVSLRNARKDGLKLVVADPRRTETAALSDLHLQLRPGSDPALLAGMIRVILAEDLDDEPFCRRNVSHIDDLRVAVEAFTPEVIEDRCGIPFEDVERAARVLAAARTGGVTVGTGPNMAGWGTLTEYLALSLMSILGFWSRAGDSITNHSVLMPPMNPVAQATSPSPAWDWDESMVARGLPHTKMGMPTAAAADEILAEGPHRVRALIAIGGNPVASWPDQLKTFEAMNQLDLLVCIELAETATTRFADYVLAGTHQLETPETTLLMEEAGAYSAPGRHFPRPYAMYSPAVVSPPAGSDVVDEAHFFFRLARQMGVTLKMRGLSANMDREPSIDEVLEILTQRSRVSLGVVKEHCSGYVEASVPHDRITEPVTDDGSRLDVGNSSMMAQLGRLVGERAANEGFPYRLISRRMKHSCNSVRPSRSSELLEDNYNPAFMHPEDLLDLGLVDGDVVEIHSKRAAVLAVVAADPTLRRGIVSCAHSWGDAPGFDDDVRSGGTNTNRLISNDEVFDEWSGIPVMSDVPVAVRKQGRV